MPTVSASSLGALANSSVLKPYVYGAASGRPSRGRPEKVLANPDLPESTVRRIACDPDPRSPGRPTKNGPLRGKRPGGGEAQR